MAKAVLLKRCPGCPPETALQPIENFHRCSSAEDGRQNACMTCQRQRVKNSYVAEKRRQYYQDNIERERAASLRRVRAWREKHQLIRRTSEV